MAKFLSLLLLTSMTLAACGGEQGQQSASNAEPAPPTTIAVDRAFPVTIEHKYGTTEVSEEPQRVVTVGLTDQDGLLALGITPVGTVEWTGGYPGAVGPWAEDELAELGGDLPKVVSSSRELNFEAIAALRPDLILGLYSGLEAEEYETLSQIAPTIAQSGEYTDFGMPWQEVTRTIGRAVGREERAQEAITEVEDRFVQAGEEHPEFAGATTALASTFGDGTYYVYDTQDPRVRFLLDLGFQMPPDLLASTEEAGGGAEISDERYDAVNVDMLVWFVASEDEGGEGTAFRSNPLYEGLDVAREGRDIFLGPDSPVYGAYNFNTVLSLPFTLDRLVPMMAAAIDGDPATPVPDA